MSFGRLFSVTTFGESHGVFIGTVIAGCPSGIPLTVELIFEELKKRKPAGDGLSTSRKEEDYPVIISGVYNDMTTGGPISILIANKDQKPEDYSAIAQLYRPGHADYTYHKKYANVDPRGGGRSSARETAARVAASAVAKAFLKPMDITMASNVILPIDINEAKASGDSVGGIVELRISNVPVGLGEPVFDKLDARFAYAMMGIPAVKGVEIGSGFAAASMKGSEHNDQMDSSGFLSNNAGGILGGISTGAEIFLRVAFKPISTISIPQKTLKKDGSETIFTGTGRHDVTAAIRGAPVVEAMAWLVLADMVLLARGDRQ